MPIERYPRRRGQVVKAGVCKTLIVGSIPTVASSQTNVFAPKLSAAFPRPFFSFGNLA